MKQLLTLILLFPSLLYASGQSPEVPDTVKIIENATKVLVYRNADTTEVEVETEADYGIDHFSYTITVEDSDDFDPSDTFEFEIPFGIGKTKHKKNSRLQTSVIGLGHIYVGQRFNYFDKGPVKNAVEWGIRNVIGFRWSRGSYSPSFSVGLGIGFQKYRAQDGYIYAQDYSNLVLLPVEDEYDVKSTELNVFKFQVPLLFTIPLGCDVKFTAGGIGCFNTYARAHTEIKNGNTKIKADYKGLQQRLFTAEVMASIGVCDILGVYVSWSPMTLFQKPYGPQLKSWSIGATVNF